MLIRNGFVTNPDFLDAFNGLMKREMPIWQCLEMSKSVEEILKQVSIVDRAKLAIADQYGKKENGQLVIIDKNVVFDDDNKKNICLAKVQELLEETFEISLTSKVKVPRDETFTPYKFALLQDVIEIV